MFKNTINITGFVSFVKNIKTKENKNLTSFSLGFYNGKDKKSGYVPVKYFNESDSIYKELQKAAQKDSGLKAEVTGVLRENDFEDKRSLFVFANQITVFKDDFKKNVQKSSVPNQISRPSTKSEPVAVNTPQEKEENLYPF